MQANSAAVLPPHQVRTVNVSQQSSNKIHDNATAARYGFRGGLVPGTMLHAHLATPLVQHFGERWLDGSVSELKLLQPAYDGELLTVTADAADDTESLRLVMRNEAGVELAVLQSSLPATMPPVDERVDQSPAPAGDTPVPISWDTVRVGESLRALQWCPTREDHEAWCDAAGDHLPIHRQGERPRLQPGKVLQGANEVFRTHYALGPWIHVGSRVVHRAPLRLGDAVEIRAVTDDKWERKGHEFIRLYVAFLHEGTVAAEVLHTAIYKLRDTPA